MVQYPVVFIREDDKAARNSTSKKHINFSGDGKQHHINLLLQSMESPNTLCFRQTIIFATVNEELRS